MSLENVGPFPMLTVGNNEWILYNVYLHVHVHVGRGCQLKKKSFTVEPSIVDTIRTNNFVHYSEVSLTQGLYISSRHSLRHTAVEHNVATFSELSLAVRWQAEHRLVLHVRVTQCQVANSSSDGGQILLKRSMSVR